MISLKLFNLTNDGETEKIFQYIDDRYLDGRTVDFLKRVFGGKKIVCVVEYPYYDSDYLSTYYLFYNKKYETYPKSSYRLHIYENVGEDDKYRGSIVLRPTKGFTNISKTYLDPRMFVNDGYFIGTDFTNSVLGEEVSITAFPWMKQETDITVCAHVALWSIIRYYGTKYSNYQDATIGEIVSKTPESNQRKWPLSGLSMAQIPETLKRYGFSPVVIKRKLNKELFVDQMFAYIESGIPVIGCLTEQIHAVSVFGHGKIDYEKLNQFDSLKKSFGSENIILSNELIDSVLVNDDSKGPYLSVSKEINVFDETIYSMWEGQMPYSIADFDYWIIPLYNRMQFNYASLAENVKNIIKKNTIYNEHNKKFELLDSNEKYVVRIYISSTKTLKREMIKSLPEDSALAYYIRRLEAPKFLWNVDFSTISEYKDNKVSVKMIVDTTSCNVDEQPWLLIHNKDVIFIKDTRNSGVTWITLQCATSPYPMQQSNLISIKELYRREQEK